MIVLQTEDIELVSKAEIMAPKPPATTGTGNTDSTNQTRCCTSSPPGETDTDVGQSRFVLINGFDLSRLLKLAKKWTFRRNGDENSDDYDGDLPLEEMQKNGRHKRASL